MSGKGNRIKAKRHDPKDQYRLLFESNPHPMWVYDIDTLEFLTVNEAAIHRYGYSRDEFLGMTIKDIRPPEDIPDLLDNVSGVTEGFDDAGIWRHKKKDGSIIYVEISSHTINFNDRRAEMVLANDITKRKQAEDALKLSEEKYRDLFDNANDAICIMDSNLKFRDANKKTLEMTGYSKEELLKMSILDIIPPGQIPRSQEEFEKLQEKGYYEKFIGKIRSKDGGYRDVEVNSSAIINDGRVVGSRDIIRDITERKQAEKLQREKTITELYGFIVSALPVFASNVPSHVRHNLIRNFAERFDENIRPRYEEEIKHLPCGLSVEKSINEGIPEKLDIFMLWLGRMFENINIRTNTSYRKSDPEGIRANLEFFNCPWKEEAKVNPIFCFICRTVVLRSFTWTKQKGSAQQKSSIANGSKTCRFEIMIKSPEEGAGII